EERGEELAQAEMRNVGKPIRDARGEVGLVVELLHYYAGAIDKFGGQTIPVAGGIDMTFREPLGVVGVIVPWNFPLAIASWKLVPALACGNAVVVKPAELTPLTALLLAEILAEAGFPDGVVNVVTGAGSVVGRRLAEHEHVARIAFTGSTEVGRGVMAAAAGTIKRVTLELGGKSANVVFADADLERAAEQAPGAVFGNAGQDCCARSRILVQREAYDRFLELFVAATARFAVGDPADEATQMGPLISQSQRELVASYVDGDVAYAQPLERVQGFWYPPTILAPVANGDRVAREEVFGPVAAVIPFADEAEAVRLANDTPYGLSGSIWTRDGARALRVARAIESGALSINSNTSLRVATPFGGFKQSGLGRELGMAAMEANTELKNVYYATGEAA
ncbi:MAG: aldehyde dehydrogenase family protein, partial [Conexibacter sp.]